MDIKWNTAIINPQELIHFSRGDNDIIYKYLHQFKELIPPRIKGLEESLKTIDRKKLRQVLHQMSPQLQFFGISDLVQPIRRLGLEYEIMPLHDLISLVNNVINKLKMALKEVDLVLEENF